MLFSAEMPIEDNTGLFIGWLEVQLSMLSIGGYKEMVWGVTGWLA